MSFLLRTFIAFIVFPLFTYGQLQVAKQKSLVSGTWKLVWADEFNYSGLPDTLKWSYDVGGEGWGNNEKQYYTCADTTNAMVKNGVLTITAIKKKFHSNNYTSARLTTKNKYSIRYGRIEVRAKLPQGRGLWPAIWMLPVDSKYGIWPNSGEIDIMEHVGYQADTIYSSIHTGKFNHLQNTQKTQALSVPDLYTSFHVFGLEWQPEGLSFFVDGKKYMTVANTKNGSAEWPFNENFYLLLNLAVGGDWGGKMGVDNNIFPARMEIDYVRIYKHNHK